MKDKDLTPNDFRKKFAESARSAGQYHDANHKDFVKGCWSCEFDKRFIDAFIKAAKDSPQEITTKG